MLSPGPENAFPFLAAAIRPAFLDFVMEHDGLPFGRPATIQSVIPYAGER